METKFIVDEYTSIVERKNIVLSKDKIQNLENYWKTIENRLIFIKKDNPTVKNLKTQMDSIVSLLKSKQKTQEKENITLTNDDKEEINTKLSEFNDFIKEISQDVNGFDKIKEVIDGFRNTYYDLVGIDINRQQNIADNNIELFTMFYININKNMEKTCKRKMLQVKHHCKKKKKKKSTTEQNIETTEVSENLDGAIDDFGELLDSERQVAPNQQ